MDSNLITERWQAILNGFTEFIVAKGLKPTTRLDLTVCISEFILFAHKNNIEFPSQCSSKILLSYFQYITSRPKGKFNDVIQGSTPNHHVYALRVFFGWLFNSGAISFNPVVDLKFPKYYSRKVESLSVTSIQKLFSSCESDLERILLSIFYGCGLRRSEGQSLLITDIVIIQWKVIVRKGKFSKRREIPIGKYLHKHFINYVASYHQASYVANDKIPFFIDENKIPIDGNKAYQIIKHIASKANLNHEEINLHLLRHSIATHLLLNGMQLDLVRKFLGHNSVDTTQHYLNGMGNHWKWNQRNHLHRSNKSFNHDRT